MILISLACAESISMQNNYPSWEVSTYAARHRLRSAWWLYPGLEWEGRRKAARSFLNYNKPPTTVNNQKSIRGSAACGDLFENHQEGGYVLTVTVCENMHDLVNWDEGYSDRHTCTCLHGACVLGMSWWVAIRPLSGPPAGSEQLTDSTSEQL